MTSHFRVVIKNCSGHELPSKDRNGYSDPYLCFDFDHFKAFKTEVVKKSLNPKWKFEKEFFYETKYRDRLARKQLIIECWDWDRVGSDDYIGTVAIDLHTLAYGPVHHNLPLRDNNKPAGRIQFDLYMQEYSTVSISLRNLRLLASGIDKDTFLEYSYTRIEDKGKKEKKKDKDAAKDKKPSTDDESKKRQKAITPKAKHVTASEAQFESGPFSVQATLHDLVAEAIRIRVKGGKKSTSNKLSDARGEMRLGPYIANYKVKDQDFTTIVSDPAGAEVGRVKGTITIDNLPKSAQLIGGEHNEHGCTGQLLLEDIEPPNRYLVKKSTKQQGGDQGSGERIYIDAAHENQYAATDEDAASAARRRDAEMAKRRAEVANASGGAAYVSGDNRARAGSGRGAGRGNSSDEDAENEYASFKLIIEDAPDGSTSKPFASAVPSPHFASQAYHTPQLRSEPDARGPSPKKSKKERPLSAELPDPATLPLPPGWERCFDSKTNREYYKDHNRHTTQWQHPEIERLIAEAKARKEEKARNLMQQRPGQTGLRPAASSPLQREPSPQPPAQLLASAPANPIPQSSSQPFINYPQPGQGQQVVFVPVVVSNNGSGGLPPRGDSNYGAFEPVAAPPQMQQQQQQPMPSTLNPTYGSTVLPQGGYQQGYAPQQAYPMQQQQAFPQQVYPQQGGYPQQQQYPQAYGQPMQQQPFPRTASQPNGFGGY